MPSQLDQARLLVPAAQKLAASAYSPLTQQYPELAVIIQDASDNRWEFFFVIASIGVALLLAPVQVEAEVQSQVCDAVEGALETWRPQGYLALKDFFEFVRRHQDGKVEMPAAIGAWVVLNLKQAKPSEEEIALAWPLGLFFLHSFKGWWDLTSETDASDDNS
ncbi:hypothetical protein [Desulfobacca acetoxidans]